MKKFLLSINLLLFAGVLAGQDDFKYINEVYVNHIKSVEFYRKPLRPADANERAVQSLFSAGSLDGLQRQFPVIRLGEMNALLLEFDDLEERLNEYTYTYVHCDKDWTPSDLFTDDYLSGFDQEEMRDFEFSRTIDRSYAHYRLSFPNRLMNVKVSGNYLLIVRNQYDETVITRRFVVVEQKVPIIGEVRRPVKNQLARTHHEILFTVKLKEVNLENPRLTLSATVVQNFDWNRSIHHIEPFREGFEALNFDRRNQVLFPAIKPYRLADIRNFLGGTISSDEAFQRADGYYIILEPDNKRIYAENIDDRDFNGSFFIGNVQANRDDVMQSEYVNVMFRLKSEIPFYEKDIYVFGAFNDYQVDEEYFMEYNAELDEYRTVALLKEGVYDYYYAVVDPEEGTIEVENTEGLMFESFNDYHIFIYYRPFGARYDRVIGYAQVR